MSQEPHPLEIVGYATVSLLTSQRFQDLPTWALTMIEGQDTTPVYYFILDETGAFWTDESGNEMVG